MTYKFGKKSQERLNTCHPDLIKVAEKALSVSEIDFGISEGHRPVERQRKLYAIGRTEDLHRSPVTYIDGYKKKGKHNYNPSLAFDFYVYIPGKASSAYDEKHLTYLVGLFRGVSELLYEQGEIENKLRFGANFDMDGELLEKGTFKDAPHVELSNK